MLLRWTATIDILTPAPLRSLPSQSKIASFTLRKFSHMSGLLAASIEQKPTRYMIRLGSWRLAHYDPTTETLLLRQSLRDAGLESFIRSSASWNRRTTSRQNRLHQVQVQHTPAGCSKSAIRARPASLDERTGRRTLWGTLRMRSRRELLLVDFFSILLKHTSFCPFYP